MDNNKFIEAKKYIEKMCNVVEIEMPERLEIFERSQLEVIFEGLLSGINCVDYFIKNNSFNDFQMDEILDGMRHNIDYTLYAKESFDWKKMLIIKNLLLNGFNEEFLTATGLLSDNKSWMELNYTARFL